MNQKIVMGIIVVIVLIAAMALPVMHMTNKDTNQQQAQASPTTSPAVDTV